MSLSSLPTELLYQVYQYLTHKSTAKLSFLYNLHSLSTNEIRILYNSENPLFETCKQNHIQLLTFLIKQKVNVNLQDNNGVTALHVVIINDHKECAQILLNSGADPNIQNNDDISALHWASQCGYKECVQLLIEHGADIDCFDKYGITALFRASICDKKECEQLLLDHGADISIHNHRLIETLQWIHTHVFDEVTQVRMYKID